MEELITVATFDFRVEAEAHKLLLERVGVRAFLADDNLVGMDWFVSNAVGGAKLQVAQSDAKRATEILAQHRAAKTKAQEGFPKEDVTFACQDCGKSITFPGERRGHVEECPYCGNYIDVPENGARLEPTEFKTSVSKPGSEADQRPTGIDFHPRTSIQLWIEVLAVLCLAYIPDLFYTLRFIWAPTSPSFFFGEMYLIVRALQSSMPLLVIVAMSREQWSAFGIVRPRWIGDVLGGCAIWLIATVAYILVMSFLPSAEMKHEQILFPKPNGTPAYFLLLAASIANGFAEELVMRGYFLVRLEQLLKSTWLAVLVTTVLFASYHLYQGVPLAFGIAVIGLVYAVSFCMFRRLWPICVAHAIADFMGVLWN